MTHTERRPAAPRGNGQDPEETTWHADVQSDARSSLGGSSNDSTHDSPPSSDASLLPTLTRLATAMEQQNEALWALVHQTATLVALLVEGDEDTDDDDDGPARYLDGSLIV